MRKKASFFVGFTIIILLLIVEVQAVLVPEDFKVNSIVPPKTGSNLKELVDALIASTNNLTDTDNDGLPDSVETVIGTDVDNTDSDFDRLTDYYEVMNNSLPWNPDSNSDGVPDYFEVTNVFSLDVDGDNISNVWDIDNDGDGVNDGVDLSPFSKSTTDDGFHFDITTDGNPTYVTFQLRPQNPQHLNLFDQFWDWPNDDKEDPMKDLDASKEDLQLVPILNITANYLPDPSDVIDYGIAVTSNSIYLPLFPVWEYGSIVAFGGKMFYPSSISSEISIDAELVWRVMGNSDEKISALQTYVGEYVSVDETGSVLANSTEVDALETLMLLELGNNRIALRSLNGQYFSVEDNALVFASSTELGEKETFELVLGAGNEVSLKAWNGLFVSVTDDGFLAATNDPLSSKFELIDLGYWPNPVPLATYKEDFMITGFTVEANYGSEVALVYGNDLNQTVAANLLLAYDFLRNSTTTVSDIPSILANQNLVAFCDNATFTHKDQAVVTMTNVLVPNALDSLPDNQNVPVIIAFEDHIASVEMSEMLSGSYVMGNSCIVDLVNAPNITTKALKTNWHNTTTNTPLQLEEISAEIQTLGFSENVAINLVSFVSIWNIGEQTVTKIDDLNTDFEVPEIAFLSGTLWDISTMGIESASIFHDVIEDVSDVWNAYRSIRFMRNMKNAGWSLSVKGSQSWWKVLQSSFRQISKVKTGFQSSKVWNGLSKSLEFAGYFMTAVDVGLTFYSLFSIINAVESPMALNSAVLELFIELTYNVILFNIGVIPVIGWLISLGLVLSDVFGGWTSDLFEWIVSLISRVKSSVEPSVKFADEPTITIDDKDGNGLDVGDRISYTHSVIGNITGTAWNLVSHSSIYPYVNITAPLGSSSTVGSYSSTEWVFQARDLGMTGNDVHLWLPIPPKSTWINSESSSTFLKWDAQEYEVGGWIEPGIGMPNFPVTINVDAVYQLDYEWEHFVFLVFYGFWCEHLDYNKGIQSMGSQTIYFDVLPATLDDFVSWREITPLDHDGDGLRDTEESLSDAWKFDTDADGLNDKFELDIGTNPTRYDTDNDGLLDGFELIYDVDPTDPDTDGDGLSDYLEESGWLIAFNYTGQSGLPFTMHVTSDPKVKDTDADGIDDQMEYWSGLNPRSQDTDADGITDIANQGSFANFEFEGKLDITWDENAWSTWAQDMAVGPDGSVYVIGSNGQILSGNFVEMTLDEWNYTGDFSPVGCIAIKEETGYIHFSDSLAGAIQIFDENGTWIKTWTNTGNALDMDFDVEGYLYTSRETSVQKYHMNGTLMFSLNHYGPEDVDQFHDISSIAVDRKNGYLYVIDNRKPFDPWERGFRLVKFDLEGNWQLTRLINEGDWPQAYPCSVAVDKDGLVYVDDSDHRVHIFDSYGMNITSFDDRGVYEPEGIIGVDTKGNIYVLSWDISDVQSLRKFSQTYSHPEIDDDFLDRDGDGLENDAEKSGWSVYFTNVTNAFAVSVTSDELQNDTDADGLTDYQENSLGTNPRDPDTDDDGLTDYTEWKGFPNPTNPKHWDTDSDGLGDGVELTYGSDPLKVDTDDDGLSDFNEFYLNSNSNNPDTDGDGLDDSTETKFNSNPNRPDSDGDLMFDGREYSEGTNPQNGDSDSDGIFDGHEIFLGTSPLNKDTDGDNVTDGIEVMLLMNPLSNDTDQDGLLDATELEKGTNPFNEDSDGDGIPDSEDEDSYVSHVNEIILAFDPSNSSNEFADNLAQYTNVTTVTVDDLLLNYTDKPYIVLVGDPEGNGPVGQLVTSLLADCGNVLTDIIESDINRVAVRHGVWNKTQTVVILLQPFPTDHYRVLDILKGKIVTIIPDSATVEFIQSNLVEYPDGGSLNHTALSFSFFKIDEIDAVKQTDSTISAVFDEEVNATVNISRYNNTTTPFSLNHASGLAPNEKAAGKYLEINLSKNLQNQTSDILSEAYVEMYYRLSDLDMNGDGDITDIDDLREESLTLYFFDESSQTWIKMTDSLDWVMSIGVNTTNVELYGEQYEGYVWVFLEHFSLYGLAGMSHNNAPDVSKAYPSVQYLWPPNHQFVDVTIQGVSDPDNDAVTITILTITSNEPTNSHEPDSYGVGTDTASLRAERLGSGDGRVYTITFLARDGNGGESTGSVNVYVQHNGSEKNFENEQTNTDYTQGPIDNELSENIDEKKPPIVNETTPSDNEKAKKDKKSVKLKKFR